MSVYVNVKCHACGHSLSGGYAADYHVIGKPIVDCGQCGTVNRHDDKCTEWELMSPGRRTRWMFGILFQTILFAGFGGFVLIAVMVALAMITSEILAVGLFFCIVGGALFYRYSRIHALIDASKQRMADPNYRRKLRSAGLES